MMVNNIQYRHFCISDSEFIYSEQITPPEDYLYAGKFTKKTDSQFNPIWEGDILENNDKEILIVVEVDENENCICVFKKDLKCFPSFEGYKVISNLCENSEFLNDVFK